MNKFWTFTWAFFGLTIIFSCADDTNVGSGLLGDDDIEIVSSSDFTLTAENVGPEPILTDGARVHTLGNLTSQEFGSSSSRFYVRPFLPSANAGPSFGLGTLDSAVISFVLDSSLFYGSPFERHDLELFHLAEPLEGIALFSDQLFATEAEPVAVLDGFVPGRAKEVVVRQGARDSSTFSVMEFKLSTEFFQPIFEDTINNTTPEGLAELINGFMVKSTSSNSMMKVDLNGPFSALIVYYKDRLGDDQTFSYGYSSARPLTFNYDLTSSDLFASITDQTDDLLYIQGHAGSTVKIDISDYLNADDPFVNHASLEFFVEAGRSLDTVKFPLTPIIALEKRDTLGNFIPIFDLTIQAPTEQVFGGAPTFDDDKQLLKYKMNITGHVKALFKGRETPILYLRTFSGVNISNEVILYGPGHPTHPPRLNLTYTKL